MDSKKPVKLTPPPKKKILGELSDKVADFTHRVVVGTSYENGGQGGWLDKDTYKKEMSLSPEEMTPKTGPPTSTDSLIIRLKELAKNGKYKMKVE